MRRLRESAIVTILLLGLTGCAGVQPRLGWTQPSSAGAEDTEGRPLSRMAFWRRHSSDDEKPIGAASDATNRGRSSMIASNVADDSDERGRPRLLSRLPVVGRFFKDEAPKKSNELDMPAARYARGLLSPPSVAQAGTAAPASVSAPALVRTTAATVDGPDLPPLRELTVNLAGNRPEVDAAAVPVRNPGPVAAGPFQTAPAAGPQLPNLPEPSILPNLGTENVPPPTAKPGGPPNPDSPDLSPATPNRGPSLPAPSISPAPESGSKPAAEAPTSSVISTPGPSWPVSSDVSYTGSGQYTGSSQSFVMSSPQGGYVSGGCESPCGSSCKKHKVCPLKKHKQQLTSSSVVYPSGQGMVSSCEATAPCKKPCFLKRWLHHKAGCKTKGCHGCKTCSVCGEAPMMVSAQSPIVSSQQW